MMLEQKHYARAPITEAVIDIRVEPNGAELAAMRALHELEQALYPKRQERSFFQAQISEGAEVAASAKQKPIGYACSSADEKQIFQVRLDGFTFSRLAPYAQWSAFRDEAKRLWAGYRAKIGSPKITRIAVRYINRVDLPLPLEDFQAYLRTIPEVSPDLPQGLSGFFMQLQIPQADIPAMLVIHETIIPPPTEDVVSVVLDLDLFHDATPPQDENGLWELIERLHLRKNEVFEACITDKTRELIS